MGHDARATVRLALSPDGGAHYSPPLTVDDADPMGRVDLTHLADGSLLVVWLGKQQDQGQLRARRYLPDGTAGTAITIAPMPLSRRSGFPRVAAIADAALVAWTTPDHGVQLTRITF